MTTGSSSSRRSSSSNAAADSPAAQLGAIAGCITSVLQRFAFGESLSAESRGGGLQSNARLLPYLMQLGLCFLSFCDETDLQVSNSLYLRNVVYIEPIARHEQTGHSITVLQGWRAPSIANFTIISCFLKVTSLTVVVLLQDC